MMLKLFKKKKKGLLTLFLSLFLIKEFSFSQHLLSFLVYTNCKTE